MATAKRPSGEERGETDTGVGRGGLPYERGRDARRKFGIKPLKETNLDVAQPFFDP